MKKTKLQYIVGCDSDPKHLGVRSKHLEGRQVDPYEFKTNLG